MMRFNDVKMLNTSTPKGQQAILDFGNYHLSIINNGYGSNRGLYEIGVFSAADGVASSMSELPGITASGDTVKGFLDKHEVDGIMLKMYTITGKDPVQV